MAIDQRILEHLDTLVDQAESVRKTAKTRMPYAVSAGESAPRKDEGPSDADPALGLHSTGAVGVVDDVEQVSGPAAGMSGTSPADLARRAVIYVDRVAYTEWLLRVLNAVGRVTGTYSHYYVQLLGCKTLIPDLETFLIAEATLRATRDDYSAGLL